jgi:hypothetical protein
VSMCMIVNPGYGGGPGPLGVVPPLCWGGGGVTSYRAVVISLSVYICSEIIFDLRLTRVFKEIQGNL